MGREEIQELHRDSLSACYVLAGTLRPGAVGRAVLFGQLLRTADRAHVWALIDTLGADGLAVAPVRLAVRPNGASGPGAG